MSDPALALQTAIYAELNANLTVPIYDAVPQNASFPYVTIEYQESVNGNFLTSRTEQKTIFLAVWSDYRGQKEVLTIIAEIDNLLHEKNLTLSAGRIALMQIAAKRTNRESDGVTFMGRVSLKITLQH